MLGATYPFKKDLKASIGKPLRYEEISMSDWEYTDNGTFNVVGPSPRKWNWYATVTMKDGKIERVE